MTCKEIENMLPAYLEEDLLSPEDRSNIAGHLACCPQCSRDFAGLRRAGELVGGLGEVKPPPFFEQRIMSRIREEAGQRRGILQRIFYPLHIKLPIQSAVMVLVAVLAVYIYQTGEPEMKQMAQLPAPLNRLGNGQVTAESPKSLSPHSEVKPVTQAPAGDINKKDGQQFVAPPFEKGKKEAMMAGSDAPIGEKSASAINPADPVMTARGRVIPPVGAEALSREQDRSSKQYRDSTPVIPSPERERKDNMADTGAATMESKRTISASSASRTTAAAALKRSDIDLTIQVRDMNAAIRDIEARLDQLKARIIEKQHLKGSEFLKAEIAVHQTAAFLDLLKTIGKVNLETRPLVDPDGNISVGIRIISDPN